MADFKRPSFASGVIYQDPKAALDWLEKAFGFEPVMVVINEDGTLGHSEMRFGDGLIYVGREWDENHKSPASLGGKTTQSLSVHLPSGLDEHCERARARPARSSFASRSTNSMATEVTWPSIPRATSGASARR